MNLRLNNLYNDYCEDCNDIELSVKNTTFKKLLKTVETAFKTLHKEGSYKASDIKKYKGLVEETYQALKEGVNVGIKDSVIPEAMKVSLENDVFLFSALKTNAQLLEASRLLLDENGQIKPFYKFSEDIKSIKANYNEFYLDAEYQFAISSAQQAANWANLDLDNDRYYLQYRTANDDRVRKSHELLDKTTLEMHDDFWNHYYPPNGWRCRCKVVEVLKTKYPVSNSAQATENGQIATTNIGKDGENRFEIFRFNPGKQKVIFPPNHPYNKLQGVDYIKDLKYRDLVFNKPLEKQYSSVYNSSNGGKVLVHDLADIKAPRVKSDDYIDRIEVAKAFAKQGYTVRVLPVVDSKDIEIRKVVLKGYSHKTANPDFLIDGKYMDLKRPESIRKILKNANHAALKQESIAVLTDKFIDKKISKEVLESRMNDILSDKNKGNYTFDEVYFINKGKLLKFKRQ